MPMIKEKNKIPAVLISDIKTRLKTISGQINGIIKMLEEGKDPKQIDLQFKSVIKGINKAHYLLLDEVYRKVLAMKIVKAIDACPGDCGNEEKIKHLRKEFPNIKLDELIDKLKEIQAIEEELKKY